MTRLAVARLVAYAAVVSVGSWGIWSVQRQGDQLADEIAARQTQACRTAIETRAEQKDLLVRVVTDLGGDDETVAVVQAAYDDLPEPAACV